MRYTRVIIASGAVGSSRSQGQAKVVGRRVKGNSVCIESSIKGTGKASESDNCDSDYEYDTSDMENGECMKRRRFCVEQMDGLASHFHKFQERLASYYDSGKFKYSFRSSNKAGTPSRRSA